MTNTAAEQSMQLSAHAAIRVIAGDFTGAQADAEKARPSQFATIPRFSNC
jgi:hypothetical protein